MTGLLGQVVPVFAVADYLDRKHYLGAAKRGMAWSDEFGVLVLANPTSRHLPHDRWLELTRWCLVGEPNAGSRQWARVSRWLTLERPDITTIVSYSDPSVGHTGSLYRACNWIWAPTWHRLRPPPTGGGSWDGVTQQAPKDRWIFPLRRDEERETILSLRDDSVRRKMPEAEYREPRWKGARWTAVR
jgi:hypothetical protein